MEKNKYLPEISEIIFGSIILILVIVILIYIYHIYYMKHAPKVCPECGKLIIGPESYIKQSKFLFFSTIKWCIGCEFSDKIKRDKLREEN